MNVFLRAALWLAGRYMQRELDRYGRRVDELEARMRIVDKHMSKAQRKTTRDLIRIAGQSVAKQEGRDVD